MRKRRNQSEIQQLEQRWLLSGSIAPAGTIIYQYNREILPTPPTTGDFSIDSVAISGTPVAGETIDITPDVVASGAMSGLDYNVSVVLSTDNVWGNGDDIPLTPITQTSSGSFHSGYVLIPGNVMPGDYQLLLKVTPGAPGNTSTFPPDNNPADDVMDAGTFSVGALIATNDGLVGASFPSTAGAGTDIDVIPQVIKAGDLANVDYTVNVALSTDDVFGNGDDIALPQPTAADGETFGTSSFHNGELEVPSTVAPGTYQVLMQVSPTSQSYPVTFPTDTNPNDDTLVAGTITITPYVPPDLAVTGATFPSTMPAGGGAIDVEPTVSQAGALANVDYNISVQLSTSGTWGDTRNVTVIPVSWTGLVVYAFHGGDISIPNTVGPGTYQVLVNVAPIDGGAESVLPADANPADDTLDAGTFTITPNDLNDIGVTAATYPQTAAAGSEIDVQPTVVQTGAMVNSGYDCYVEISPDGDPNNSANIYLSLSSYPFTSGDAKIPSMLPPGSYQLLVGASPQNPSGADTDPSDDVLDAGTITITPDESPDMGVSGAASVPGTVGYGSEIDIEPTIFQSGALSGAAYNISVALSYYGGGWANDGDIVLPVVPSYAEQPFHSGEVYIPIGVQTGTYQLLIHITPWSIDPTAPDSDSTDDTFDAGAVTVVQTPPDDAVSGATFTPVAAPGSTIDVEPVVQQSGGLQNTDYQISVEMSLSGIWGGADAIDLQPEDSTLPFHSGDVLIPDTVPIGDYYILVHITPWSDDSSTALPIDTLPSDDTVNAGYIIIATNQATGDLGVTGATFPTTAAAGTNIDVEPTVVQQGALAGTSYQISVALSMSGVWGDGSNYALGGQFLPNGSQLFTAGGAPYTGGDIGIPTDVPAGQYQLLVQIQPYNSPYSSFLSNSNPLPVDSDPSDDEVDAGAITITAASGSPPSTPVLPVQPITPIIPIIPLPPVEPITPIIPVIPSPPSLPVVPPINFPTEPVITDPSQPVEFSQVVSGTITSLQSSAAAGSTIAVTSSISGNFSSISYVLSTNEMFGDSDDIPLTYEGTSGGLTTAGNPIAASGTLYLPPNTAAGTYYVFLDIDGQGFEGPQLTVVDAMETVQAGQNVTFAGNGVKYSALYLSTDNQLNVAAPGSRALLKAGAEVGTPDTKLQLGKGKSTTIPANAQQGAYQLLALSKHNSKITDLGTILVNPLSNPAEALQATVKPRGHSAKIGKSGSVKITFHNAGAAPEDGVSIELYLANATNPSSNDVQLNVNDLSTITLSPSQSVSGIYTIQYPASLSAGLYHIIVDTDLDNTLTIIGGSPRTIRIS